MHSLIKGRETKDFVKRKLDTQPPYDPNMLICKGTCGPATGAALLEMIANIPFGNIHAFANGGIVQ
ncbi:hypothetical protein DPMN_094461 [Dreissena polymorpha]|uniref:Uncharacterized protein n=1 Tax=Dreissena polymorpha TaxID=45954 RepID=A0A9D4R2W2_DREPO|nr:hypothetical protein DPMN_094461 [Dreissena polymorpha]